MDTFTIDPATQFTLEEDEDLRQEVFDAAGWREGIVIVNLNEGEWACNVLRTTPDGHGHLVHDRTYLLDDHAGEALSRFIAELTPERVAS
jgi:hypothetical protein